MESEHAPLRIQVPHLRKELRIAAPDDGRRSRVGVPRVPVRGGRAAALDVCHERMRDSRCWKVHLSTVEGGRSAAGRTQELRGRYLTSVTTIMLIQYAV